MSPSENLPAGSIDLHSHTTASDGTFEPGELIALARERKLAALSITDHDTFDGFEAASRLAGADEGLRLVRGIELNSRLHFASGQGPRFAHMLVYFPSRTPSATFLGWLDEQRAERRERNRKLASALRERGVDIALEEVEARGRSLAGRPHFARLLVEKGYVNSIEDAFKLYLGEEAPTYVERESKTTEEVVRFAREGGGLPVVAHPIRLGLPRGVERDILKSLRDGGLVGLEVYHSDHSAAVQAYYRKLADELELLPTGGSDFHGDVKPDVELGSGRAGNVRVPMEFLEALQRDPA